MAEANQDFKNVEYQKPGKPWTDRKAEINARVATIVQALEANVKDEEFLKSLAKIKEKFLK